MTTETRPCPVCGRRSQHEQQTMGDFVEIDCPDCGRSKISDTALAVFRNFEDQVAKRAELEAAKHRAAPGELAFIRE
jgi:endogenous inhibitor of DNA gyrase (YacG/DUF329 family)